MASGIGLVIKIAADSKQAVGDIKNINDGLEGTGRQANSATGFIKGMKGPALAALGAIGVAAIAAATAMVEFGKAAFEDQQEADKLARTLRTIPGITQDMIDANEAWITQTMFATHVLDTELRQAISDLTLVTGDLTTAQKFAEASANLATVADVEYTAAVAAVEKALAGKTTSLMKMAPWLDKNKDGSLSAAEAQAILTDETLRGAAAAEAANDPWTSMQLVWDELKEALGQWLLPIMQKLSAWFADPANQQKIAEFTRMIAELSRQVGEKLVKYLDQFLDWLQSPEGKRQIAIWIEQIKVFANIVSTLVGWLMKAAEWISRVGTAMSNSPLGGGPNQASFAAPPSTAALTSAAAPAGRTASPQVVINFNAPVGDQEGTARAIAGILNRSDLRMSRSASARAGEPRW